MAAQSLAEFFNGVVVERKWEQPMHIDYVPNYLAITDQDGNTTTYTTSYSRYLYTARFKERRYSFIGVPKSVTTSSGTHNLSTGISGSVSVTDVDGVSHSVFLDEKFVDGSQGSSVIEKDNNSVEISRMTPHMWRVDVVRRVCELKCNGSVVFSMPDFNVAPGGLS